MNTEFDMKKKLLKDYIEKWNVVQEGEHVNQLHSETENLLRHCINDSAAADKVKNCVQKIGPLYAINGQMDIPYIVVDSDGRDEICKILKDIQSSYLQEDL